MSSDDLDSILARPGLDFIRSSTKPHQDDSSGSPLVELITYCRLPGCVVVIERAVRRGRNRWFCCDEHRHAYRLRGDALDRAITDLTAALSTAGPVAELRRQRGVLNWLSELRVQYDVSPRQDRVERDLKEQIQLLIDALEARPTRTRAEAKRPRQAVRRASTMSDLLEILETAAEAEALRTGDGYLILLAHDLATEVLRVATQAAAGTGQS